MCMTQYTVVSGDDQTTHYSVVVDTLLDAACMVTAGDYVMAIEDGEPRPLSEREEIECRNILYPSPSTSHPVTT